MKKANVQDIEQPFGENDVKNEQFDMKGVIVKFSRLQLLIFS
jgi:hypothetical protein